MSSEPTRSKELSAGGVVVRDDREVVVIVPTRRAYDGSKVLALPKGHVDPGESAEQAATREVREETGIEADLLERLGQVRYWYRRQGRRVPKAVEFFLFRYRSGSTDDHDEEVEDAHWLPIDAAARELTYAGEREMVERALSRLRSAR
ncbi:MAG TPA: NUDIX domain-containing protein [Solirubrobacteraceae bacterium]|jgi:8-oxo-dGTP pyrophosphatase MutT (NUDIX family)|nr:NUDIX domain-containing protein [Solirubrobacteraceae bacterium]